MQHWSRPRLSRESVPIIACAWPPRYVTLVNVSKMNLALVQQRSVSVGSDVCAYEVLELRPFH